MKFTKVVKADENFNEREFNLKMKAVSKFYDAIEEVIFHYKKMGLSKEAIFEALEEASTRNEDTFDEL